MMSVSLVLSPADLSDPAVAAQFMRVADAATAVDGYTPFNEQALLDLAAGRREAYLFLDDSKQKQDKPPKAVGAAAISRGDNAAELDLVIAPKRRGKGFGNAALGLLLPHLPDEVTAWSHGDHPAARVLAVHNRFVATRTLLHLKLSPLRAPKAAAKTAVKPDTPDVTIDAFVPGVDDEEWVALNALVFASHPEQGSITLTDLADRQAEPWFDAGDFLVARDAGRMIGYNWLKIDPEDPSTGEIYVIGIHPDAAGQGLGRRLMERGLARLSERGCTSASLYVEADNTGAVRLYRSLGFTDFTIDVQYKRLSVK